MNHTNIFLTIFILTILSSSTCKINNYDNNNNNNKIDLMWYGYSTWQYCFEASNVVYQTLALDEELNQYYIDILLAETPPTDIPSESLTLKIDEDFDLDIEDELAQNLTFVVGDYPYNESLSTNGGYRIYLQ